MNDPDKTKTQLIEELSQLRQQAKELEKNASFQTHLLNAVGQAIIATDRQGYITYFSRFAESLYGWSKEEALGRDVIEITVPHISKEQAKEIMTTLQSGDRWNGEFTVHHKNGKLFQALVTNTPIYDESENFVGIIGVSSDITQYRQVENALKKSKTLLTETDRMAHVGGWELDLTTMETFFTDEIFHIYELPIGTPPSAEEGIQYYAPEGRPLIEKAVAEAIEKGTPYDLELPFITAKGNSRWVRAIGKAEWIDGKATRLYGVMQDITDNKRIEEELRRAHNLESLGVLAGGIAHDFNNILTGVMGNLSLLLHLLNKDSTEYEIANEAQQAATKTRGLTQQLLTFAKGGAPIKETASIEKLIHETTKMSLHGANTKPEFQLADNLLPVDIDTGQISQVIQNLVLNADQAMPNGGLLTISAQNVDISDHDPLPLKPGTYVQVSVTDQGIGISETMLTQVFNPYFSTKEAGHGLGLSISHSIIQRHGGHITVSSQQNVGTTFTFYLPASDQQTLPTTKATTDLVRGTGKILIMDDAEMVQKTVRRMLNRLGYEAESAFDGEDALQQYQTAQTLNAPFDIVIMDLTIPGGMGGKETITKMLEIDPQARVIVSSGYATDPVMAHFSKYGFVDRISKPIDMEELANTVKRIMDG